MKLGRIPLLLAVVALVALAMSGLGVRLGLWSFGTGFEILRWAAYGGLAVAALALVALVIPKMRSGAVGGLVLSVAVGLAVAYLPWRLNQQAQRAPPIHDISTDLTDPPEFVAVLPHRADAQNPATYGGPEVAAAQRKGYPDIQPLELAVTPDIAYARALAAAHEMGWEPVAADAAAGRIEATATTLWFGFKDDAVVRIRPAAMGSRVDVRSVSRVGGSDVGTNAKRIRAYLAKVASQQ
jgi:uncharacterized protein (DUF1499 family)